MTFFESFKLLVALLLVTRNLFCSPAFIKGGTSNASLEKAIAQKSDYDSLIQSISSTANCLHEDLNMDLPPIFQASQIDADTLRSAMSKLNELNERLLFIYGHPGVPPEKSLVEKLSTSANKDNVKFGKAVVKGFAEAIEDVFQRLRSSTNLSPPLHHLRPAVINCILRMLRYLHKYELIPVETEKKIQRELNSPASLQWIAKEMQDVFMENTRYDNSRHYLLTELEFLQNHPQLSQFYGA
ncbi:hypothetical protein PCASD_06184 [Puccinia coronata f. sp. avenae]|uniref:Uncharacterized protein n=1 Tax=Puccinia coronata f. sp. avenae TaxID=200324 RepID=A0A2N5TGH4_9BASI|nr:hypothetical protein PCASD_06184 [Puccinia coronata f. sp. avenae]